MIVRVHRGGLSETKWYEYLARFLFGGFITAMAGLIADQWGPVIAGLFLAFPAIFPATATLVEKHARERKQRRGLHGEKRATLAAADDAMGTAIGSVGLIVFAIAAWRLIPASSLPLALIGATLAWMVCGVSLWFGRKHRRRR